MKVHDISIDRKYFEPVREGRVSLLIFNKKKISDAQPGDFILASFGNYNVKAKISRVYMKAFEDITEEEAVKAGFLNKDFLQESLANEFNLRPVNGYFGSYNIDKELFFLIELNTSEEEHYTLNNPVKVNLYSKEYNKEFYNPEYDMKPWRD